MSKRPRRNHAPAFKAKVALAAVKGDGVLAELVKRIDVHPAKVTARKDQLLAGVSDVFVEGVSKCSATGSRRVLKQKQ